MSKEFKIGLLALVAAILLYAGFNFLKGSDFFSSSNEYYAIYDDVAGLTISNPVKLNGLQVGRVSDIQILQNRGNKLLITLDVRSDLKMGENSKAILKGDGLLGNMMIDLAPTPEANKLDDGDTLVASIESSLLAELSSKTDPIISQTDTLIHRVNNLLSNLSGSKQDVIELLDNLNAMSASLRATAEQRQIEQLMANMNQLSRSLVQTTNQLPPILARMDTFSTNLAALNLDTTLQSANQSLTNLNTLLRDINQGEGTLGALARNDSLYNNLNAVTGNTNKLIIDLREDPKRYFNFSVFGGKDKDKKENGSQ